MAQYPIESGDSGAIAEGLNYLLSGPAGLGQNFDGFSASGGALLRPSVRQPWSLPGDTTLNPSIYLDIPIYDIVVPSNPGEKITLLFTTSQATAPFQYGDQLDVRNVVAGGVDPNYYNGSYTVFDSTTTEVTLFASQSLIWPAYVSGGSVGRDYLNYSNDTECNARVTVTGPSDQVFISAQMNMIYEYDCVNDTNYFVTVSIIRGRGFPDTTPGSNDYLFADFLPVSQRTFSYNPTVGSGIEEFDAVFTTVLDQPSFGYYWYILTVQFGGITGAPAYDVTIGRAYTNLRSLTAQVIKQ